MIDTYTSKLYKGFMPVHDQRHHKIIEFIANNDLTGVIDIGCNTGDLIRKISRSSTMRSIIGLDLDEEALSAAKEVYFC